jgi:phosphoribosylaminoimidazole carboxylase/phosphoribosylaminoimidazole-succinocarboxamide synthase
VNIQMPDRLTTKHPLGALVTEGKTKKVFEIKGGSDQVAVISKDDITAGDGAKHDIIPDKGRLANATTSNVFRLLKACGLPVAFVEQDSATSFVAPNCTMLPYEVVVRREAHGSYLKRNPQFSKGLLFPQLVVEFFLKTKDKNWKGKPLACDDPLMARKDGGKIELFNPAKPLHGQEPFLVLSDAEVFTRPDEWKLYPDMSRFARHAFLVLEKAWQLEGGRLVDFKVEFGFDAKGNLLLADVIDNDSWRVVESGGYIDKQVYRDGGALDDVAAKYARVADITGRFHVPQQRIILWRGSDKDNPDVFVKALGELSEMMTVVTCSIHKEPVRGAETLYRMLQEVPDSVVIAFIGRSNGAGPVLSALSAAPVITVPATAKEFPEDVWSSLRAPSAVPVMTVLEPGNAVLAALQILAARNPRIYAHVRGEIENRTVNTMRL